MALIAGTRFGPYDIVSPIGSGGMGEVYRARDRRLDRDVAIKILPEAFAHDADRLARFQREAKTLASLNHPGIAGIYGLEENAGVAALVMELVEGEDLSQRIARGTIPLDEALPIAKQIAEALEAAHERGIVHRDLKPANIKIRADGIVKVLDFGLAKALDTMAASNPNVTQSPTLTTPSLMTGHGTVLGTAAYMSPEQVRGKTVDKRTDIWVFGCVLYEMLTARRAFGGDTPSDSIANTLQRAPDWSALPSNIPAAIRTLLTRCLDKDPANRLHDIADARLEILDARSASGQANSASGRTGRRQRWRIVVSAVGLAAALAAGWFFGVFAGRGVSTGMSGVVEIPLTLPDNITPFAGLAVSPDGERIAIGVFAAGPEIWLRLLDSSDIRPLPGSKGGSWPFWSPDGRSLGFFADGKLKKADLADGSITTLCDADRPWGGSWSEDGIILFSSASSIYRVAASGTAPSLVAVADEGGDNAKRTFPVFLPDNRHFVYFATGQHGRAEYVAALDNAAAARLIETEFPATLASPGHLLFVQGTSLVAQAFNTRNLSLEGAPTPVARNAVPGYLGGAPGFSASAGLLAYIATRVGKTGRLTWFDRERQPGRSISQPAGVEYLNPVISPSGAQIAVNRMDPQTGNWDVWVVNTARDVASPVTVDPAEDTDPVWSPSGSEIVFTSMRGGHAGLFRTAVGSVSSVARLRDFTGDIRPAPTDWTRDGRFVLYTLYTAPPTGHADVWVLPLTGDTHPRQLLPSAQPGRFGTYDAHVSPDGRWMVYASDESGPGQWEIYVQPFMSDGTRQQISRGGGTHPRWTTSGRQIVYMATDGIVSVPVVLEAERVRVGNQSVLLPTSIPSLLDGRTDYDVTPDGSQLLVRQTISNGPPARVILNWFEKLKSSTRTIAR